MSLSRKQTDPLITGFLSLTSDLAMNTIWSKEVDSILSIGTSLIDQGINNWALSKSQALSALDALEAGDIPVLGGDLVRRSPSGRFESTYDSWHCDRLINEDRHAFVTRSVSVAKAWIQKFTACGDESLAISIVPKV